MEGEGEKRTSREKMYGNEKEGDRTGESETENETDCPSKASWVFRTAEVCISAPSNFTGGLNFKPPLPCTAVHLPLRLVIPPPPTAYCMRVPVLCVCDSESCVLIPLSEASVHHSPGYGLFEESPSHMLTQICAPSSLGPLHPAFASSNVPPPPLPLFPHLPPLHHTEPFPLPASPSLVTGMLTGTVYNKIEDEVLTLSVLNVST